MKKWPVVAVAFLFAAAVSFASAQEGDKDKPPKQEPQEEEDEEQLTPGGAMELLEEALGMMTKAEELLNDSSRGKALATQKDLEKRLKDELKDDPTFSQRRILDKIGKLVEKAEKKEKDAAEKLGEIIKKARSSQSQSQSEQQQPGQGQGQGSNKAKQPGSPAQKPYDPGRTEQPSKFKSEATKSGTWGNLPAAAKQAILDASKEDVPPEFQEIWKKYYEMLEKSSK